MRRRDTIDTKCKTQLGMISLLRNSFEIRDVSIRIEKLNTMGSCLKMVMRSLLWLMFAVGVVVTAGLLVIVLNTSHSIEWVDVDTHVFRVVADKYVDFEGKERGFFLEFVNGKQLNKCELIFYTSNNDITCMVESFRLTKHDVANNKMTKLYRLADALIDDCRDRTRIVVLIDREFSPVTIGESLAIEIAFKPSVHGERINPLQFSFISQKVSFVDMPGW